MGITLKDLRKWWQKDRKMADGSIMLARQPTLYCVVCNETYSANPSDYFVTPEKQVFACCDEPMRLVFERTRMIPVELAGDFDRMVEGLLNSVE